MNRDAKLLDLRENVFGEIGSLISDEEKFQNQTLRPILKLQNEILLQLSINHIQKYIKNFRQQTIAIKTTQIENAIQKDHKFKNLLIGTIVGHFTINEYVLYTQNQSNLNKRLITMLVERINSQIQLLDI